MGVGLGAGGWGLVGAELWGRPGKVLSLERTGRGRRGGGGLVKKSVSGVCCL